MRKLVWATIAFVLGLTGLAGAVEFGYPAGGEPWYFLKADIPPSAEMRAGLWTVSRVEVNGQWARDFVLFQRGRELTGKDVQGDSPFEIKVRHGWRASTEYQIVLSLANAKTAQKISLSRTVRSPSGKGYWNPAWKNYLSLLVSEENGIERTALPVHATVGILSSYLRTPNEIRVVKAEIKGDEVAYADIPRQIYEVKTWDDKKLLAAEEKDEKTGRPIIRYHPTTSLSLAFLADLKPRERATYLVFYNNPAAPKPAAPAGLTVTGKGIGKTIENKFYKAVLHPKAGVLYEITEKASRIKLEHKLETNGSIHWNPCVFAPPHAWYHTSDWENPPFTEISGPLFYSIRIAAPIPAYKDVLSSVTYYFYAGTPFVRVETTIDILNDLYVQALRNGEIVFNKKTFDKAAYKAGDGGTRVIDFADTRMHPDHVITLRPDTPWVTFYSESKGVAFANLYLDLTMLNRDGGEASAQQPFLYIQHGPWYYLARGLVYSFGTNNQTRMLPVRRGSVYYERNAFLPFALPKGQGVAATADRYFNMLKYPVSVLESIETYLESPEGWVVPILTEPFEEGVKDAVGSPKKK